MCLVRLVVAVTVLSLGPGACAEILVDGNLPAGNCILDGVEGDTVYVRQDQSTTDKSGWFYWAFRVRGAAGRTLTFDFRKGYPTSVGPRGPVVTLDRGQTYSYPCDKDGAAKHPKSAFTYAFPADVDEVWFYECLPYQQAQWDAFLARHEPKRGVWFETGVLCKSKKGRDVERARFGCIGKKAKWRMMTTCRHHCSESVASYVNEGLCTAFLGEDELGEWLRANVELMTIPFIDKDGVEDGDQGKNRPPHDHNRDYGAFIYPETKAMTEWARDHAGNDIAIYLDLHCPWIRGEPTNEHLYTPFKASKWYRDPAFEKADRRFSQTLERVQCGSFRYKASDDLDYGRFWNTGANYAKGGPSTLWGLTHFTGPVSRCVEIPFQNANGAVVTRETCRELGRDLAKAARAFLLDEEARRGRETKITFLGDVMCHGAMLEAYRTGKTFDFSEVFAGVIPLLSQSDLVCANIETPLAENNGDLTKEKWRFNSPRQFAQAAKAAGIDIAFTANNHCLDRGLKGLASTLHVLDECGFRHTGTFADRTVAETPLFAEVNGFKIGLLSYTYGSNAWSNREYLKDDDLWHVNFFQRQEANEPAAQAWLKDRNSSEGRAYAEMEAKRRPENLKLPWYERTEDHERERNRLAADVARMRKGDPDFVVMSMHAGGQYNPEATAKTKELAEFLLKSGVDVIAGSHEHVVHGSDFSRLAENKLVTYSLGDFDCLHGTWVKPPNPTKGLYPDYSIAWHVYLTRDADGKARVSRTDFDVLKIVKGEKNGRIRVVLAKDVPGTEEDVAAVSRRFAGTSVQRPVVVECEAFEEFGGWMNDSQFMDQMGSPYLLAHGLGHPVADAKTSFRADAGRYSAWVRTKDWTAPWAKTGEGAGRFMLSVNGKVLPQTLGIQGGGEWLWTKAGEVELAEGANTVALHDLTGFDGRCDAVAFVPADRGSPDLDRLRKAGDELQSEKEYDLVVVGGGIAGICASVTASRLGLSTALVHDRPVLGGNNSSEVRVHLGAYQNLPPYPRLGDVLAEFAPIRGGNARPAANYEDGKKMAAVCAERNLDLYLEEHVNGVDAVDGVISSVHAVHVRTGGRRRIRAKLFADCTGDGTVGFLAGADFRQGREGRSEYGESLAPERADQMTMGASVQWYAVTNGASAFPREPWMLTFDERSAKPGLRGDWDWETGLGRDQVVEAERIRDYGLLVVYSNWSYLKNGYSGRNQFAETELAWVAYVVGKRESRRLLGDYILTQRDLDERKIQPDGTCVTTWTIDQHYPWPESHTGFGGEPFLAESRNKRIWPYPIPYRCFYSRNVRNLFMAGRDISVTHIALGTTRLMRTHGMMGEVVGMAAAVCRRRDCGPRQVYEKYFEDLRSLMTAGVGDRKEHPRQDYNCQSSLDPEIRKRYSPKITGRLYGQSTRKDCE